MAYVYVCGSLVHDSAGLDRHADAVVARSSQRPAREGGCAVIATKTYPGGVVFASVLGGSSIEAIVDNDAPAADLDALAEDAKTLMTKLRVLASERRQNEQGKKEGT